MSLPMPCLVYKSCIYCKYIMSKKKIKKKKKKVQKHSSKGGVLCVPVPVYTVYILSMYIYCGC